MALQPLQLKDKSSQSNLPIMRMGVYLLIIFSIGNAIMERLFPVEPDFIVGALLLIGFWGKLVLTKRKWRKSILDKPVLIILFAMALSLLNLAFQGSQYFNETAIQYVRLISIMVLSLLVYQITDGQDAIKILKIFTVTVAFVSLLAIFGFLTGISFIRIGGLEISIRIKGRLGGIYEQPNTFGAILTLAFPIGIVFTLLNKSILKKLSWIMISILCLTGLFLSQSRSAILGALVGIFTMAAILRRLYKGSHSIVIILLAFAGALAMIMATGMLEPFLIRLNWDYYISQRIESAEPSRLEIWNEAIRLAFNNPFGYGAETKYIVGKGLGAGEKSVHNVFLSFLSGMGVLGFIGIIILATTPLRKLWKLAFAALYIELRTLAAGLFAGLVGFWIFNLAHSVIHWVAVWVYFACAAAVIRSGDIKGGSLTL